MRSLCNLSSRSFDSVSTTAYKTLLQQHLGKDIFFISLKYIRHRSGKPRIKINITIKHFCSKIFSILMRLIRVIIFFIFVRKIHQNNWHWSFTTETALKNLHIIIKLHYFLLVNGTLSRRYHILHTWPLSKPMNRFIILRKTVNIYSELPHLRPFHFTAGCHFRRHTYVETILLASSYMAGRHYDHYIKTRWP